MLPGRGARKTVPAWLGSGEALLEPLIYPHPIDLRWNHIDWFAVFHRDLLNGSSWMLAGMEERGFMMSLFAGSMESVPPATLPSDDAHTASRLRMSLSDWAVLAERYPGVLAAWVPVRCGKDVLRTHPAMLEALAVAVRATRLYQRGTTKRGMWEPPDAGRNPA